VVGLRTDCPDFFYVEASRMRTHARARESRTLARERVQRARFGDFTKQMGGNYSRVPDLTKLGGACTMVA